MSEHRRAVTHLAGSPFPRRRRWLVGAAGALGVSGLILGGVGVPASAGDANAGANVHATADVSGGCLTAVVGTGGADGSVQPQQDPTAQVEAAGQGTATASVCPGDPAGALPEDPGGSVVGAVDEIVPGDPGGSVGGEVTGVIAAALDGELPGDGGGSGPGDPLGGLPGDLGGVVPGGPGGGGSGWPGGGGPGWPGGGSGWPGGGGPGGPGGGGPGGLGGGVPCDPVALLGGFDDVLPCGLGGLVPAGSGLVPGILDRLPMVVPGIDAAEPGGNDGDRPELNPSGGATTSGSVAVGGLDAERVAPTGQAPGGRDDKPGPGATGTDILPGGTLPRTGGGLGTGVLRLIAFLGFGRAALGLMIRHRRAGGHNPV